MFASKNGHKEFVELLCSKGADVNQKGGWNQINALMKASGFFLRNVVLLFIIHNYFLIL